LKSAHHARVDCRPTWIGQISRRRPLNRSPKFTVFPENVFLSV